MRLTFKPGKHGLPAGGISPQRLRPDQLDGGASGQQQVPGAPHFAHPAPSQKLLQLIAAQVACLLLGAPDHVTEDHAQRRRCQHEYVVAPEYDERLGGYPVGTGDGGNRGADPHDQREGEPDPREHRQRAAPMRRDQRGADQRDDRYTMHVRAADAAEVDGHQGDGERRGNVGQSLPAEKALRVRGLPSTGKVTGEERQFDDDAISHE